MSSSWSPSERSSSLAEDGGAGRQQCRQHRGEGARQGAFAHGEAVAHILGVAQIDERVDRLPDGRHLRLWRLTDTDAVDRNVVVVGERDGVAVRREAAAEPFGQRQALATASAAGFPSSRACRADSTTMSAVMKYLCPRCVSASVGTAHTRQPSRSSLDSDSTRTPVKISAPNAAASAMYVEATVVLAPTLQPPQQSPHSMQASCCTPAALGPLSYDHMQRNRLSPAARRPTQQRAVPPPSRSRAHCAKPPAATCGARARSLRPEAGRGAPRCGHAVSSNTRASGDRQTLALISDVPPSPHAISTLTSLPTRTSNSAVAEPRRPCGPFTCVSALARAAPSGKSPGRNSRPRSSTATFCPQRASREAATPAP